MSDDKNPKKDNPGLGKEGAPGQNKPRAGQELPDDQPEVDQSLPEDQPQVDPR